MHANRSPSITLLAFFVIIAMVTLTAMPAMALKAFLKLEGIEGDATFDSHEQEIRIKDFLWGLSQSGTMHVGSGGGIGKASFDDLLIVKNLDVASPLLAVKCASGKHFQEARLTIYLGGAKKQYLPKFEITLKRVIITSCHVELGDKRYPKEHVGLNFAEVHWAYQGVRADGTPDRTIEAGWNVSENVEQ